MEVLQRLNLAIQRLIDQAVKAPPELSEEEKEKLEVDRLRQKWESAQAEMKEILKITRDKLERTEEILQNFDDPHGLATQKVADLQASVAEIQQLVSAERNIESKKLHISQLHSMRTNLETKKAEYIAEYEKRQDETLLIKERFEKEAAQFSKAFMDLAETNPEDLTSSAQLAQILNTVQEIKSSIANAEKTWDDFEATLSSSMPEVLEFSE